MSQRKSTREPINFLKNLVLKEQARKTSNLRDDPLAICRNILGVDLWPSQEEIIGEFYAGNYKELVICAGRRSSKSYIAALIGHIETYRWLSLPDPWDHFNIQRGVTVYGIIVAPTKDQAKDYPFMYYKTLLRQSWWYKGITSAIDDKTMSVEFPGRGLTIKVGSSMATSLVGGTLLFAVMDEVSKFTNAKGQRTGDEVHAALTPSLRDLRGPMIDISSPIFMRDKIMRLLEEADNERAKAEEEGRDPEMLAYHRPTWEMNPGPNFTREALQPEFDRDPEKAKREWAAIPSYSIEPYFMEPERVVMDKDRTNPAFRDGTVAIKRKGNYKYYMHGDPALRNDCFGLAVAHCEGDKVIIDFVWRFVPLPEREIDAQLVKKTLVDIHRKIRVDTATFDMVHFPETMQILKDMKVEVEFLRVDKKHYDLLKDLIYAKNISIPYHELPVKHSTMPPDAIGELRELELHRGIKVDHPTSGSKDVADAIAGATFMAYMNRNLRRNIYFRAGGRRRGGMR